MRRFIQLDLPDGVEPLALLSLFYTKPHYDDLVDIIEMTVDTYNAIVSKYPLSTVKQPTATVSSNSGVTVFTDCKKTRVIARVAAETSQALDLPASYWIDKYVKIKNAETSLGYSEAETNVIIRNATDLINSLDLFTGMRYIASKFDNVAHFEGSLFYDVTKLEMKEDPNALESSVKERVQQSVQASNFVQH